MSASAVDTLIGFFPYPPIWISHFFTAAARCWLLAVQRSFFSVFSPLDTVGRPFHFAWFVDYDQREVIINYASFRFNFIFILNIFYFLNENIHSSTRSHPAYSNTHFVCNLLRWSIMNWINGKKQFFSLSIRSFLCFGKRQYRTFYESHRSESDTHALTRAHHIHLINTINLLLWQSDNNIVFFSVCNSQFYWIFVCVRSFSIVVWRVRATALIRMLRCALHMLLKSPNFFHISHLVDHHYDDFFLDFGWVFVFDVCIYGVFFVSVVHHTSSLFMHFNSMVIWYCHNAF